MGGGKFSWESHCYSPGEEGQKPRLGWVASLIGYEGSKAISALLRGMLLWPLNAEREEALGHHRLVNDKWLSDYTSDSFYSAGRTDALGTTNQLEEGHNICFCLFVLWLAVR